LTSCFWTEIWKTPLPALPVLLASLAFLVWSSGTGCFACLGSCGDGSYVGGSCGDGGCGAALRDVVMEAVTVVDGIV